MARAFQIEIITPEKCAYSGEVTSLMAPGEIGYLGILADHAPLVTPLKKGRISVRLVDRSERVWEIDRGFLEVSRNQATLLVESIKEITSEEAHLGV